MSPTRPEEAAALLAALWEPLDDDGGLVELRPIFTPRPPSGSPLLALQARARRWLPVEVAIGRMPEVLAWCARVEASAFYGVLPRQRAGVGGNDAAAPGAVAWVDLDGWKTGEGAGEALARLGGLGTISPSATVASGRGVHAYWLLSEPEPAAVCAGLSARLAALVGGDAASDPARLLRLPGAPNPKHAGRPLARLVALDAGRRFHAADLDDWLPEPLPVADGTERAASIAWESVEVPRQIPGSVREAYNRSPRLRELWRGEGRPDSVTVGGSEHRLDRSRSGYDVAVAACLLEMGIREPGVLVSAVRQRRRDSGRAADARQDQRAVEWVLHRTPLTEPAALRSTATPGTNLKPAQLRLVMDDDPGVRLRVARRLGAPVKGDPLRATGARCPSCGVPRVSWFIEPEESRHRVRLARCWACHWRGGVFAVLAAGTGGQATGAGDFGSVP